MTLAADHGEPAPTSRKSRLRAVNVSRTNRAAVSNRSTLIAGLDGRTEQARRFRDLVMAYSEDLGGFEGLSEDAAALVKQAAATTMETEQLQARIARGEAVNHEQLTRLSNSLTRLLKALHSRRAPKKEHLTIADIAARHRANAGAAK